MPDHENEKKPKKHYQIVIDQGGQSTRLIVFDHRGFALFKHSLPTPPVLEKTLGKQLDSQLTQPFIEYEPEPFVESAKALINILHESWSSKNSEYSLTNIGSVNIIAQRSSIIACDKKTGEAITPMISWQDTRNHHWLKLQFNQTQLEHFQAITGLRLNAHAGVSKIRWLLDNHPLVQQKARDNRLVFMPWGAYFLQCLSGHFKAITDPILASRMYLTEYDSVTWCDELLEQFSISKQWLPDIVPSQYAYGELLVGTYPIPIRLLGGDQNFVSYAYGSNSLTNTLFLNMGTGAFIQALAHQPAIATQLLRTVAAVDANKKSVALMEGTINAAASAIDWAQNELGTHFTYTQLNELFSNTSNPPIFINTLAGVGSPYWLEQQANKFLTVSNTEPLGKPVEPATPSQKMLSVIESVLFLCVINAKEIMANNAQITHVIISGGLSNMNNFCQQLANILALPVKRYQDSEASARGVIFYRAGHLEYEPKSEPEYEPEAENQRCFKPNNSLSNNTSKAMQRLEFFERAMLNSMSSSMSDSMPNSIQKS